MKLVAIAEKITAASSDLYWGSSFAENGLFVVLEIEGRQKNPAPAIGKNILDALLTKFTNLSQINYKSIAGLADEEKDNPAVKTLILGVLTQDHLYLKSLSGGQVRMDRKSKTGLILASGESSSGTVAAGDKLLFASATFAEIIGKEKLIDLLKMSDQKSAAETAASLILPRKESSGAAAILLTITAVKEKKQLAPKFGVLKNKIIGKIRENISKVTRFIPQKQQIPILENTQDTKAKKTLLTVAAVLTVLLISSIFFNISHGQTTKRQQQLQQVLDLVSHQYEEADSLLDLNPVRARTLLSDSKLSLSPLLSEFPKNTNEYKQVNEWLGKIAEKEVVAYKIYKLTAPLLFFDLSFIKAGAEGTRIADYQTNKAILDLKNKVIYTLSTDKKQSAIVAGSETVKEATAMGIHGNNIYLLNSDGIVRIDIPTKTAKVVVKKDEDWGEIVSLASFGGNIYLLDTKKNAVWKYIATDYGFSAKANYLNPDVRVNFSQAKQLLIDGSVWVLSTDGEIQKFTRGLGEPFAFKGFAENLQDVISISTNEDDKNLYILDRASSRIVVFAKDGSYQSQYQWDEMKNASDFVAMEAEKKIFAIIGGKIYAIDIK